MFGLGAKREVERRITLRFNKIFSEHGRLLRADIGNIVADHAAKGLLRSGATIKRLYRALDARLSEAVTQGLDLVSNKTEHAGAYRSKLLDELRNQVRHHSLVFNEAVLPKVKMAGGSNDAMAAAERLFRDCVTSALDQVDKYDDGLTAPKNVRWHERHPIWSGAIGAAFAAIVGAIIAGIVGLF